MTRFKLALFGLLALLTSGCSVFHAHPTVIEKTVPIYVEKRVECPSAEDRAALAKARPQPLRETPMPDSVVERSAKSEAQLGKYEATGGYADQVEAVLDRCQKK